MAVSTVHHFVIEPLKGVRPIRFGMHKDQVSLTFTYAYASFFKGPDSKVRSGPVIRSSGGLRKVRWSLASRGKRGGVRIIYFWDEATETFYMLYMYPKNEQEDLTARQLRILARLVREEFG